MPDPSVKPPDLDAQGQPVQPPDLDAQGNPVSGGGGMNFAIVNGERVPVDQNGDLLLENIKNLAGAAGDVAVGAGKSLLRTAVAGGALLRQIPGVDRLANALPSVTVPVDATNTAQKVGGAVEQAAEVLTPSRAITSAGMKTAEVLAPALTRILGAKAAQIAPLAAVEAAGNMGIAKMQGASTPEAAATGVLSAAVPTVGNWAVQIADALKGGAASDIGRFFNPTTRGFKNVVQKRTPEILDRGAEVLGPLGRTREGAVEAFGANRQAAGEAVDDALKQFGNEQVTNAPQRLMAALDTAKAPYVKTRILPAQAVPPSMEKWVVGRMPDGRAQLEVPLHPAKVAQIDALKQVVQAHGDAMTIDDLVGVRRAWDEVAYAQPGATLQTVKQQAGKWAKKMGGDSIRAIIQSDKPDLAEINREFSFWRDLENAMSATVQRKTGQVGGLLPPMAEGAGRVAGEIATGSLGGALAVGKLAKMAQQVFASPRYASLSANIKTGLADALTRGDVGATTSYLRTASMRLGLVEAPRLLGDAVTP